MLDASFLFDISLPDAALSEEEEVSLLLLPKNEYIDFFFSLSFSACVGALLFIPADLNVVDLEEILDDDLELAEKNDEMLRCFLCGWAFFVLESLLKVS